MSPWFFVHSRLSLLYRPWCSSRPGSRRARLSTRARMPRRGHAHVCARVPREAGGPRLLDAPRRVVRGVRAPILDAKRDTPQTLPGPVNF
ncbi:hypothetical protein JB92DRAFT_2970841 [Gautieria morchelliformis]|nr:hypothetical protein JB92DRAFT_2970841 [Gautieria morchelliformis]